MLPSLSNNGIFVTRTNDGGVYRKTDAGRSSGRIGGVDGALQGLLDREAVAETISRLFIETDRREWEGVKGCLADEVLFDLKYIDGNEDLEKEVR
jgi:hypothetical protein